MSKKIVGVTVGTTINPKMLEKKLKPVKTVNGVEPDENGNVQVAGSADAVQANLDAHNQSKKNPHTWKPTAEEVGARPSNWMPTAEEVGAATKVDVKKVSNPHNLLDNSDFRNPVNQRGESACGSSGVYWLDRWIANNFAYCDIHDGYIGINAVAGVGGLTQRIANPTLYNGKRLTLAVCARSNGGKLRLAFPYIGEITNIAVSDDWSVYTYTVTFTTNADNGVAIFAESGSNIHVRWAALYEGEYTAETIPEYHPKGYAVELAECQRHYVKLSQIIPMFCFDSGNRQIRGTLIAPTKMREFPRVENHTISWIFTSGYDTSTSGNTNISVNEATDGIDVTVALPANIVPTVGNIYMVSVNVWLSADL